MAQLPNELQTVFTGDFEEDPEADTLAEFGRKFNENTELLDEGLGTIRELDQNMDALEAKGLTAGFLYGGTY
jgi:hypothetical protein